MLKLASRRGCSPQSSSRLFVRNEANEVWLTLARQYPVVIRARRAGFGAKCPYPPSITNESYKRRGNVDATLCAGSIAAVAPSLPGGKVCR